MIKQFKGGFLLAHGSKQYPHGRKVMVVGDADCVACTDTMQRQRTVGPQSDLSFVSSSGLQPTQ